jgi:predicted transcriptional regulator
MITKTHLISTFEKLPENLTIDQVIDHLIFVEKVQKGLEDSEKGRVFTADEAKLKLIKWLK